MADRLATVSLFSGCGGSDLGATRAGAEIIFANDNYQPAAETYRKHQKLIAGTTVDFRGDDVRDIRKFPNCDLLLGCYPCQSFTMGGNRDPDNDPRTNLYREFRRCLQQTKPKFFVAENVAGLQWLRGGAYLDAQLDAFLDVGQDARCSGLRDPCRTEAPIHRRRETGSASLVPLS